ncbi:MAG: glycosyltransferase [Abditibacteriales bacterium]|nr:glycosyltransferase [Abditibacteriales bacterium]MDW8367424.1 glycosyltransferase [Abditibacteriales bacterium]
MRILYLNHVAEISGAEMSLLSLLGGLDKARYEPVCIVPGPGPLTERLLKVSPQVRYAPFVRFKRTRNPLLLFAYANLLPVTVKPLVRYLVRNEVHLIHSNSTIAHLHGGLAARQMGLPCVWHVRDLVPLGWWARVYARWTHKIIAISEAVRTHLQRCHIPAQKIAVIPNGVDLSVFAPRSSSLRPSLGFTEAHFVFGMVAQLVPWKGHAFFLRAAAQVAQTIPNARFLLVGDDLFGDHPAYVQGLLRLTESLGLEASVRFLGFREDIVDVLASLDALVLPSFNEPFGRVLVEAMAMAKPVIATNVGGPPEIVDHEINGLLVPVQDVSALADAMRRLAQDRAWSEHLGKAGRAKAEREFDIALTVQRTQEVYEELRGKG